MGEMIEMQNYLDFIEGQTEAVKGSVEEFREHLQDLNHSLFESACLSMELIEQIRLIKKNQVIFQERVKSASKKLGLYKTLLASWNS